MDKNEIAPITDTGDIPENQSSKDKSLIFQGEEKSDYYYEIYDKSKEVIKIIFASEYRFNVLYNYLDKMQLNKDFKEIIIIFDFNNLAEHLDFIQVEALLKAINKKNKNINANLSLIIKNCNLKDEDYRPKEPVELKLKKLEIQDELYSFSPNIKFLFSKCKADEVVLKKFKFNSKEQLEDFSDFIQIISCNKLTLDDFFIELIIKKDDNDNEYNDLDIYFELDQNFITFNHFTTYINSLTLRDCPLFAIVNDIFSIDSKRKDKYYIDIDQNSILNPSIITKFKMNNGQYDICFDLDSFKLRLEEEEKINNYDYVDLLYYIFYIINPNWDTKKEKESIIEDTGTNDLDPSTIHKIIFKNFDTTKYEYITGEEVTYIDEDNWVLSEEEDKKRKKFEELLEALENNSSKNYQQIKELVFDNCSNFFIKWAIIFLKGKDIVQDRQNEQDYDFDLLKLKKCGKDLVDLSRILKMKIKKLILFDTPLIIAENYPKKPEEKHLNFKQGDRDKLGSVDCLTIKLNSLDCYGREYNLNVMLTYEILIEMMELENFNKNLVFEFNALSSIMTYLAYKEYVKNQSFYNNQNDFEDCKDDIEEDKPLAIEQEFLFKDDVKYLPKYIFFSSKKYRDYIYSKAFKLNMNLTGPITIKNTSIKRCYENYENQNYILSKIKKNENSDNKSYTTNKELRKIDFGSDGFYIERDYKYFFFENKINNIILENVSFSNYKDNSIESKEAGNFETINNFIGTNKYGLSLKKYEKFIYPNYIMDVKTFNGIFFKNYGYDNVATFFKHYMYKTNKPDEQKLMSSNINIIKSIFEKFKNNIKNLSVIINNIKEQKQFYVMAILLDFLIYNSNKKGSGLPDKKILEAKINKYFTKEKNEYDTEVYSEFNYYFIDEGEKEMMKTKQIKINGYNIDIDRKFNFFEDDDI